MGVFLNEDRSSEPVHFLPQRCGWKESIVHGVGTFIQQRVFSFVGRGWGGEEGMAMTSTLTATFGHSTELICSM